MLENVILVTANKFEFKTKFFIENLKKLLNKNDNKLSHLAQNF